MFLSLSVSLSFLRSFSCVSCGCVDSLTTRNRVAPVDWFSTPAIRCTSTYQRHDTHLSVTGQQQIRTHNAAAFASRPVRRRHFATVRSNSHSGYGWWQWQWQQRCDPPTGCRVCWFGGGVEWATILAPVRSGECRQYAAGCSSCSLGRSCVVCATNVSQTYIHTQIFSFCSFDTLYHLLVYLTLSVCLCVTVRSVALHCTTAPTAGSCYNPTSVHCLISLFGPIIPYSARSALCRCLSVTMYVTSLCLSVRLCIVAHFVDFRVWYAIRWLGSSPVPPSPHAYLYRPPYSLRALAAGRCCSAADAAVSAARHTAGAVTQPGTDRLLEWRCGRQEWGGSVRPVGATLHSPIAAAAAATATTASALGSPLALPESSSRAAAAAASVVDAPVTAAAAAGATCCLGRASWCGEQWFESWWRR